MPVFDTNSNEVYEIEPFTTNPDEEPHIIINPDRTITVPKELKAIGAQKDHNIETVIFDCPRYWDGKDLSEFNIFINYRCPNTAKGNVIAENITVDEVDTNLIHFSWTISNAVTQVKGKISISIKAVKNDENSNVQYRWNTTTNDEMEILESFDSDNSLEYQYPDLYSQLLDKIEDVNKKHMTVIQLSEVVEQNKTIAMEAAGKAEKLVNETYELVKSGALQGPQGESGVTIPASGFYTLSVDPATGNLYAHTADDSTVPPYEYDEETGNLYFITED